MVDVLRCTALPPRTHGGEGSAAGVAGCYASPLSLPDAVRPDRWPLWRGGPESTAWANNFFASAADMARFLAMLASGGVASGGVRRIATGAPEGGTKWVGAAAWEGEIFFYRFKTLSRGTPAYPGGLWGQPEEVWSNMLEVSRCFAAVL